MGFALEQVSNKNDFLQGLFTALLNAKDFNQILPTFLEKLECLEYKDNIDLALAGKNDFILFHVLQFVIKNMTQLDEYYESESSRMEEEGNIRLKALELKQKKIDEMLDYLGILSPVDRNNICLRLEYNPAAFRFCKIYATKAFFFGCSPEETIQSLTLLSQKNMTNVNLKIAVQLFPGRDLASYICNYPSEIDYEIIESAMLSLPEESRLRFIQAHKDNIESLDQVTRILKLKPTFQGRLDFALALQDKIQNGYELADVLKYLLSKDRPVFVRALQDKIQDDYQLRSVLQFLDPKDRIDLAKASEDKIQDGYQLRDILQFLDPNDRLDLAQASKHKIRKEWRSTFSNSKAAEF
jgi:hypothetical protein